MFKKNDLIEISITDTGKNAEGVGRAGGFTFFVKDALPGDTVRAVVTKVNKSFGYAKTVEIIQPSPDRTDAPCPLAKKCGGCQLMELSYKKQLEIKEKKVFNDLERIGGVNMAAVKKEPIIGTGEACPLYYRNKVQLPAGKDKDGRVILGFYAGRTHYIIETENCPAAFKEAGVLIPAIRDFIEKNALSVYDEKTGKGLIRHVLLRKGFKTGQIMVCLIVNEPLSAPGKRTDAFEKAFIRALKETCPDIASICVNSNTKRTNVILGQETKCIYGKPYIEDKIFGLAFRISAASFFQVNGKLTEKLYAKVLEYAALTGSEVVWDLYCGTGTISLFLAQRAKMVYGVEIIPEAIENARENAALNNIENARFFCGRSEEIFPEFYAKGTGAQVSPPAADVVVLDPPRKGCDESLLRAILLAEPKRIVYVSCSSATLARDVKILGEKYSLVKAAPCDMFPHTVHCETVCLLEQDKNTVKSN